MVFIGLIVLISLSLFFLVALNRRFEEVLPLSICLVFLVLHTFFISGWLRCAVPVIIILSVASVGYFLVSTVREKNLDTIKRLFTPGLAAFLLLSGIILFLNQSTIATKWDEFTQWITATRALWLSDTLGHSFGSIAIIPDYPLFEPLMGYFFMKFTGGFSEPVAYFAKNVVLISLLLPALRNIKWNNWYNGVLLTGILALIPLVVFPGELGTLYADCLLGVLATYMLLSYFTNPEKGFFTWISVAAGFSMLSMTKPVGIGLACIVLAIVMSDVIFVQRKKQPLQLVSLKKRILAISGIILAMLYAFVSWRFALPCIEAVGTAMSSDSISNIFNGLQAYQLQGVRTSITLLFADQKTGVLTLSILSIASFAILPGLFAIEKVRGTERHVSHCILVGGTALGFFAYYLMTVAAISLFFSPRLVASMNSFDRYMGSYLVTMLLVFIGVLIDSEKPRSSALLMSVILCCLIPLSSINESFDFVGSYSDRMAARQPFESAQAQSEHLDLNPQTDRICIVSQGDNGLDYYLMHYLFMPIRVDYCCAWSFSDQTDEYDDITVSISAEEWGQALTNQGFDYVYLHTNNDAFIKMMSPLFASVDDITDRTFYHVVQQDEDSILLVPAT